MIQSTPFTRRRYCLPLSERRARLPFKFNHASERKSTYTYYNMGICFVFLLRQTKQLNITFNYFTHMFHTGSPIVWEDHIYNIHWIFVPVVKTLFLPPLNHWGRVTHICVGKLTVIGSDNGLSPGRCQAIIWTNAGILFIEHLGTNFSEILIEIHTFSFKKIDLKMSFGKWRPSCHGLNVLTDKSSVCMFSKPN